MRPGRNFISLPPSFRQVPPPLPEIHRPRSLTPAMTSLLPGMAFMYVTP